MRILILNWYDIKNPKAGGAHIFMDEIFSRLSDKYQITLLCSKFPGGKNDEQINGLKIKRIASQRFINLYSFFWYLKNKKNFDLIIDFTNKIPYLTPLYVRHKPVLAFTMNLFGEIFIREWGVLGYLATSIEKFLFSFYKKIPMIAISMSTKDELIDCGLKSKNIRVIYPGIDHKIYRPGREKSKSPLIICVSRLKKYKRVDFLLSVLPKVLKTTPDLKVLIVGEGDDKKRLLRIVQRLNLKANVSFLGYLSDQKKIEWLKRAWVSVQSSTKEGWGLTVIEAAACGTPTIAANVAGLKESVIDGKTGWLFNDSQEFQNVLIEILTNHQKRIQAGKNALRFAQNFSWDKTAWEVEKEIRKLLEENGKQLRNWK